MNLNNHFYMENIVSNNLLDVNIVKLIAKYIVNNVRNIIGVINVMTKFSLIIIL